MEEQGLAMQMAGEQQAPQQASQGLIDQIVRLLLQGVSPEELIQQGVPQEAVEEAMRIALQQAEEVGQPAAPPMNPEPVGEGLAANLY